MFNKRAFIDKIFDLLSNILLFLLTTKVLFSLYEIANIIRIDGFIIFTVIAFAAYYLFKKWYWIYLVGLLGFVYTLYHLYKVNYLPFYIWLKNYYRTVYYDLQIVFSGKYGQINDGSKSLLFLLLLWIIITILVYLSKKYKAIWIMIGLVVYFSVIDSLFSYNSKWDIIIVLILGLLMVTLERQRKLLKDLRHVYTISFRLITTAIILSIIVGSFGYVAPKADAKWSDPTGWFSGFKGKGIIEVGSGIKKVGYSSDDSYLGGSFIQDDTIVMETTSTRRVYWRGESKDHYTGHGWIDTMTEMDADNIKVNNNKITNIPYRYIFESAPIEYQAVKQSAIFHDVRFNHIFTNGDVKNISLLGEYQYDMANVRNQQIYVDRELEGYTFETEIPIINEGVFRLSEQQYSADEKDYLSPFLQLPDRLPARVEDLAFEITEDQNNTYDKINAIRSYLKLNYQYNIEEVPIVEQDEDFVDQFLFEDKIGYCDHFSTSLVVLSRSIGIPARWVKGFSPGDIDYNWDEKMFKGVVRNRNAHSWVEVYFAGIGWVPFEPTPSFRMPLEYRFENISEDMKLESPAFANMDKLKEEDKTEEAIVTKKSANFNSDFGWVIIPFALVFAILLIKYRLEIILWWIRKKVSKEKSLNKAVLVITDNMLYLLQKRKQKMEESQTLREYMGTIFTNEDGNDWKDAVSVYETARYSSNAVSPKWHTRLWSIWRRIIKGIYLD